jgi:ferritin-like metal-binding protein YciE
MKLFSANIQDLRTLYIEDLKKALDMEQKIVDALPKMIDKSTDTDLKAAFENHLRQTEGHVVKVESLISSLSGDNDTVTCKVINSLVTEAEDSIKDATAPDIRDVTLIAGAQQVEHHEIAVYGTLRNWANLLGLTNDAQVIDSILAEEKAADKLLTAISDEVNLQAAA